VNPSPPGRTHRFGGDRKDSSSRALFDDHRLTAFRRMSAVAPGRRRDRPCVVRAETSGVEVRPAAPPDRDTAPPRDGGPHFVTRRYRRHKRAGEKSRRTLLSCAPSIRLRANRRRAQTPSVRTPAPTSSTALMAFGEARSSSTGARRPAREREPVPGATGTAWRLTVLRDPLRAAFLVCAADRRRLRREPAEADRRAVKPLIDAPDTPSGGFAAHWPQVDTALLGLRRRRASGSR
jgi:hypothetical protein